MAILQAWPSCSCSRSRRASSREAATTALTPDSSRRVAPPRKSGHARLGLHRRPRPDYERWQRRQLESAAQPNMAQLCSCGVSSGGGRSTSATSTVTGGSGVVAGLTVASG